MAHAWKACWVQALGGSNPPSSATGPRDLLRFRGFVVFTRKGILVRRGLSALICDEGYRRKRGALDGVSWV